ncbi:MAG: MauE/DoxX family redox-associated membrane protein [Bacteroidota bacterium]
MPGNYSKRRLLCYALAVFFIVAGANHFRDPNFYLPLIPPYFHFPEVINWATGILEVLFGGLLLLKRYRLFASFGILSLLLLFIPSHVYFIKIGSCIEDGLCVQEWIGWLRLFVIHPLLLFWVWIVRNA